MTRSILITGCSSGVGYDAAHALAARGWRVFAACRQEADCERLRGEGLESPFLDYCDPASIEAALAEVLGATGGTLDALFNNGAHGLPAAVEDLPTEALRDIFESNLFGWHDLTRRVIPVMRAQGHGRIVNCSSVLGITVMRWRGAYNATKFALEGLEMRGTGIHVSTLRLGPITTRFRINSRRYFERWIDWERSPRAEDYRRDVLSRLHDESGRSDRFELPPAAVTTALIAALESPRPRAHYHITHLTRIAAFGRRFLPVSWADWIIARV